MAAPSDTSLPLTIPPLDKEQVAQLEQAIQFDSTSAVLAFGDEATREMAAFSNKVLADIRVKDASEVGDLLLELTTRIQNLDPESLEKTGFWGKLFGSAQAKIDRFARGYDDLASQLDGVGLRLDKARELMRREIVVLDQAYDHGLVSLRKLDAYLAAGEGALKRFAAQVLPELEQRLAGASETERPLVAQILQDQKQNAERLERKVHDLKLARMGSLQRLPQIRIVQHGDAVLMDKIHTAINTAIPMWKAQFITTMALGRQRQALHLEQAVEKATNDLIVKNAELLHANAVELEQAKQKGVLDIGALSKANALLVSTIQELSEIQSSGKKARAEAEVELAKMENELRDALLRQAQPKVG